MWDACPYSESGYHAGPDPLSLTGCAYCTQARIVDKVVNNALKDIKDRLDKIEEKLYSDWK